MKDGIIKDIKAHKKVKLFFDNEKAIEFDQIIEFGDTDNHIVLKSMKLNQVFHVNLDHVVFARVDD